MSIKSIVTFALAAGFAAAKPINAPVSLPSYSKRQSDFGSVVNGFNANDGAFNFIDGFNNFNQQQQVVQIQEQNLQIIDNGRGDRVVQAQENNVQIVDNGRGGRVVQAEENNVQIIDNGRDRVVQAEQNNVQIIDNGRQQQVVQQIQQVLVVDQVNNGFNNDLNNLFRKSNMANQRRDVSTVMLVVQQIQVSVDDGRGNQFQQDIFAQSAVVANRGRDRSETVMIFDSRTLIAQDVLGNNAFGRIGRVNGVAGATGVLNNALPTKTAGVQLFGAKPTWSSVVEDPAASLGDIWQGAVEDLQKGDNDAQDMKINEDAAAQEKQALDEAQKQEQEKAAADEAKKQEEEQAAKQAQNGTAVAR